MEPTKRHIRETGLETRIAAIVEPVAEGLGYRLVRVRVTPANGCTLQIMAEDANGDFTVADCERLSRDLSPALDVADPIDRAYHLEVSSPGIDRPLVRLADFDRWTGHEARIELSDPIDGRRRFRGVLAGTEDETVLLRLPDAPEGAEHLVRLPADALSEAKLVLTDELLAAAEKRQAAANPLDEPDIETVEDDPEPAEA